MTLLLLAWEFFKTGLFSIGGGLATLPFLENMTRTYPSWFTKEDLYTKMVPVSESTPGPLGIKTAAYVGYHVAGIPGLLLASFSIILPSVIIILVIAKFLTHYQSNRLVKSTFGTLRPVVAGLIANVAYGLLSECLFGGALIIQWIPLIIFAAMLLLMQIKKLKVHPIVYIACGAVLGIVLKLA